SIATRSLPSLPMVKAAVRVLPLESFQRANRSPLRVKISAPAGSGLVKVFLKTVPMFLPTLVFCAIALGDSQVEQFRQGVEGCHRQAALSRHESAHGRFTDAQLFANTIAGKATGIDGPADFVAQLIALLSHRKDSTAYFSFRQV